MKYQSVSDRCVACRRYKLGRCKGLLVWDKRDCKFKF